MAKFTNFECKLVNETEVDIYINGCLEWRLVLSNRTHDIRNFQLARPGRDAFNLDYRWTTHFDIVSRNIYNMVSEAVSSHVAPGGLDNNVVAIMAARKILMAANAQYLPKLRA